MPKIISISRWRPLYEMASQLYELAPWNNMYESEIFGIKDPQSGTSGYVSVMGNNGEHYALNVYLGQEGLTGFFDMLLASRNLGTLGVLMSPQLQLSFEERDYLEEDDLQIIHELGYKAKGRQAWPLFRSYRPGYAPWFFDNDEIELFKTFLQQALIVLQDQKQDQKLMKILAREKILMRVAHKSKMDYVWQSKEEALSRKNKSENVLSFFLGEELLEAVKALPRRRQQFYVDAQLLMTPIAESRNERPYLPCMLLMADKASELILHFDTFPCKEGWVTFVAELPERILDGLVQAGSRPTSILVKSIKIYDLLKPIANDLQFSLKLVDDIPVIDDFLQDYHRQFGMDENVIPM